MVFAEVWTAHVPVEVLCLHIEGKNIRKQPSPRGRYLACSFCPQVCAGRKVWRRLLNRSFGLFQFVLFQHVKISRCCGICARIKSTPADAVASEPAAVAIPRNRLLVCWLFEEAQKVQADDGDDWDARKPKNNIAHDESPFSEN